MYGMEGAQTLQLPSVSPLTGVSGSHWETQLFPFLKNGCGSRYRSEAT